MSEISAVQFSAYGSPEILSLNRIPAPRPGPGEILIETHAVSVNPIDCKIRSGSLQSVFLPKFPITTGRDGAGIVRAVGDGVDVAHIGERVCFLAPHGVGTWAEQIVLPVPLVAPIPPEVTFAEAAALPLAGLSAWAGLVRTANLRRGMRVLIHAAAGGVGSFAVQIAHEIGASIAATCSRRNVDFVRALGAHQVIPYDTMAFEEVLSELDVVFDVIGGDVHRRSYKVLGKGGVIACLSAEPYWDRGADYGVTARLARVMPDAEVLGHLVSLVATGRIRPSVDRVLPFTEFAHAQAALEGGHARGKIVLTLKV